KLYELLVEQGVRSLERLERILAVLQELRELCAGLNAKRDTPPRLIIDLQTNSARLDGQSFDNLDPDALRALNVYHQADGAVLASREVCKQLLGCNHETTLSRWLAKLPQPLHNLLKGKPGSGRHLALCPLSPE